MNNYKKGYTLIEVIVVIFIMLLLGDITLKLSLECIKDYENNSIACFNKDKLDNALLNIDSICNVEGILSVESNYPVDNLSQAKDIKGDNILIKSKDSDELEDIKIQIIYLKNEKLMVRTLNYNGLYIKRGDNTLIDNVDVFRVNKKKKTIYFYIKSIDGEVRIRCI